MEVNENNENLSGNSGMNNSPNSLNQTNNSEKSNDFSNELPKINGEATTVTVASNEVKNESVSNDIPRVSSETTTFAEGTSEVKYENTSNEVSHINSEETTSTEISNEVKEENVQSELLNNNEPTKTTQMFEEVEIKKTTTKNNNGNESYYDGTLLETIGWNLLRILLIGISFTLAKPWGDCMVLKYRVGHTVLNGKRLKFEGNGGDLFVERFKWIFLTIITFTIYAWFIPMKKKKWVLSHIHFEDEELVSGESYFDGKLIQLIGLNILSSILITFSCGLLYPFTNCLKLKWLAKHSIINKKKIVFDGKALNLWGHYILWFLLTIITFGIYGWWLGIKMTKWEVKNSHIKLAGEVEQKTNNLILIPIFIVSIILGAFVVFKLVIPTVYNVIGNQKQIPIKEGGSNYIDTAPVVSRYR